jgi:chromate reductase
MTNYKVGYFIGSLAKASINRKLSRALVRLAPSELEMSEIPFKDLPLYSYDYDAEFPAPAKTFKDALAGVEAVLFITPEYNRSIPGGLKNAIDWASRPYGQNSFTRKPSAVIGTSPGAIGTAIAQQHLRSLLGYCNSPQMNAPEAYIQFTPGLITDDGQVTNEKTEEFLRNYISQFHAFIMRVYSVLPRPASPAGGQSVAICLRLMAFSEACGSGSRSSCIVCQ